MQIAIFKISDVKKANEFIEQVDLDSAKVEGDFIALFYNPRLSPAEFRKNEILRTIRQVEKNLEVAKLNTKMFEVERDNSTGTERVKKEELIETSKGQERIFIAKLTELAMMLNGQEIE